MVELLQDLVLTADGDDHVEQGLIVENDCVDDDNGEPQRSLGGCPSSTDETDASKLPSETYHISPARIPEKANQDMAIGNKIECDDFTEYLPEVLNMAKENYEGFFDVRRGTSTQQQIDRSSLIVAGLAAADVRDRRISREIVHFVRLRRSLLEEDVGHSGPRTSTAQLTRTPRWPS